MSKSVFAIVLLAAFSTAAYAGPITDEEKQFCAHDYRQYCGQDGLGSNLLRDCMNAHGKSLSEQCIKALVDAGEVSEAEVEKREKAGKQSEPQALIENMWVRDATLAPRNSSGQY